MVVGQVRKAFLEVWSPQFPTVPGYRSHVSFENLKRLGSGEQGGFCRPDGPLRDPRDGGQWQGFGHCCRCQLTGKHFLSDDINTRWSVNSIETHK